MKNCIRKATAVLLVLTLLLPTAGCLSKRTPESETHRFEQFLDLLFIDVISSESISLHFLVSDPSVYHLESMPPSWFNQNGGISIDSMDRQLRRIHRDLLSEGNQLTYDILRDYIDRSLQLSASKYEYMNTFLGLSSGVQTSIPINLAEYEFIVEKDITDYLSLLEQLPDYVDMILEWEQLRVDNGFGAADFILDQVIEQCDEILADGADFYLVDTFSQKLEPLDFLTAEQKQEYAKQELSLILDAFMPAFTTLRDTVKSFKGKGENSGGLSGFENGADYYELLVQKNVGVDKSCDELIQMLEADESELIVALRRLMQSLVQDHPELYEKLERGEGGIELTDPKESLDFLREKIFKDFPEITGDRYVLNYLPSSMEEVMNSTLAYYVTPPVDNFLTGKITVNGAALGGGGVYSTLAHEGYPGHMYQHIYFYNQNPASIRKVLSYPGYSEGWAVYAENYSYSLYDYREGEESLGEIERLSNCLNWNLQCRLDLGIHYQGWTRERVAGYLESQGFDASVANEVFESIVGNPGVFLNYYIGYLEFKDIYDGAKEELGVDFDPIEFHAAVLGTGSCSFAIVRDAVDAYIAEKKN